MYEYYRQREFNPTYANIESSDRFNAYSRERHDIFQNKLHIPTQMFKNCEVLEFGPAGGENSLVLATWGANLHLVEPVEEFHETIRNYFSHYQQTHKLQQLSPSNLSDYVTDRQFDIVMAEGFVHTTGATSEWTEQLARHSSVDGLIIINFLEQSGYLIEILHMVLCRVAQARHHLDEITTAQIILGPKWGRIHHHRSFSSWANDVIYNPFSDSAYLNHSGDVIQLMHDQGFEMYSSWPSLQPNLDVRWIKREVPRGKSLEEQQAVALQLIPSMILGESVSIKKPEDNGLLRKLLHALQRELEFIGDLARDPTDLEQARLLRAHEDTTDALRSVVEDYPGSPIEGLMHGISRCISTCFEPPEKIAEHFLAGTILGSAWGSPTQWLVFQHANSDSDSNDRIEQQYQTSLRSV